MQSPYSTPPIPVPDGSDASSPVPVVRGDWAAAPKVVRNWAYQLTWLGMVAVPIAISAEIFRQQGVTPREAPNNVLIFFYLVLLGVDIWLNRALKRGDRAAWPIQIVISVLSLAAFPLGTLIHGYILSQWFKPETKAWFGQ